MAVRNPDMEFYVAEQMCQAIKNRLLVKLHYEHDRMERVFAPYAMYESILGNIIIYGLQVRNPSKPLDDGQLRYYSLRRLRSIRLTDTPFHSGQEYSPELLKGCRQLIVALTEDETIAELPLSDVDITRNSQS